MPKSNYKSNELTQPKPREPMTAADVAYNKRMNPDVQQEWVEKIWDKGRGMSAWERDFVESVEEQLSDGRRLSERQVEILERIYAERTS